MAKGKYILFYDKYIGNKVGGVDIQRVCVKADTKTLAEKRMKEDLYKRGAFQGLGFVYYPDGKTKYIKPRKAPEITYEDRAYKSNIYSRTNMHCWNFGKMKNK